ncbi:hypothetical protein SS1G_00504 [Sclerotinia sclerotiorum 1980 UF-70]|uniref:HD/PDEase domain-containing protein n=2 Tax=Sclerotinia sclerotiorum (strain ATCC 18683 / 1980 / Ss-1) TaxID=665079 RepID=A7E5C9_SCLS1|nr:hypothetical protein SS1G_00504 [Sclerotinia sclerotiorum 1980 UF-70]APA07887.1 hypothetical protein sscle_03g026570 [Sclerotinia sclerotiorum 1980 UF-70]EDN91101.1 hypothetical protein SS1G_00504 [Sclerotinia sclerotiorum 1980 UF-70]
MAKFDASHDFAHIKRVVRRAHIIHDEIIADAARTNQPVPQYDVTTITLSALLHDVGDRKYVNLKKENPKTMINTLLLGFGANTELAVKVQTICSAVSYFEEMKDLLVVRNLINQYPELAIVQDADRLDSLGAIGIGKVFTYGGAKTDRSMLESIDIFDWKLLKLQPLMKTEPGRGMAQEATGRLELFKNWWVEEVALEDGYEPRIT